MIDVIREISRKFDSLGLHYKVEQGKTKPVVRLSVTTKKNNVSLTFTFFASGSNTDVSVRVYELVNVPAVRRVQMLRVCNRLNNEYRFAKFCLDDDLDLNIDYDITRCNGALGETVMELIIRFMSIADDAYPQIMRQMWA